MALYTAWYNDISSDTSLLHSAVDDGLRRLRYGRIKIEQLDVVESPLSGKHVTLIVPTGFGKSLVYQLAAVLCRKLSLMYDQVAKLIAKGVKAVCIYGEKPSDVFADTIEGRVTHVLGSPESIIGKKSCLALFTDDRFSGQVVVLAIDEAHCIVKW